MITESWRKAFELTWWPIDLEIAWILEDDISEQRPEFGDYQARGLSASELSVVGFGRPNLGPAD